MSALVVPMSFKAEMARRGIAPMQLRSWWSPDTDRMVDPLDDPEIRAAVRHCLNDMWHAAEQHDPGGPAVSGRPTPEDVTKAIAIIEDSRRTHVEWAEWLERSPLRREDGHVGDLDHHRRCIADYDHVLAVLRAGGQP